MRNYGEQLFKRILRKVRTSLAKDAMNSNFNVHKKFTISRIADEICDNAKGKEPVYLESLSHVWKNELNECETQIVLLAMCRIINRCLNKEIFDMNMYSFSDVLGSYLMHDDSLAEEILPVLSRINPDRYTTCILALAKMHNPYAYLSLSDFPTPLIFNFLLDRLMEESHLSPEYLKLVCCKL